MQQTQWLLPEHAMSEQQHWGRGTCVCGPVPRLFCLVHSEKGALRMEWAAWQGHLVGQGLCFWGIIGQPCRQLSYGNLT